MIDRYTHLLEVVAEQGDEAAASVAVQKLVAHLKSSGRVKMLPDILAELRKIVARRRALEPVVEVAHEAEAAHALQAAAALGITAKRAKVNHSLVRGWRARTGDTLVDRSAKRALVDIYQKVTG